MANDIHLSAGAAESLQQLCRDFAETVGDFKSEAHQIRNFVDPSTFRSAVELGGEYDRCVVEAVPALLEGFVVQADALSAMFGIAGGVLSAQDEAAADALRAAASAPLETVGFGPPAGLGAIGEMLSPSHRFAAVAEEDPYALTLEQMLASGAALDSAGADAAAEQLGHVATTLDDAAATFNDGVVGILGTEWQGDFAQAAADNVAAFCNSATALADTLTTVVTKASGLSEGFTSTKAQLSGVSLVAMSVPAIADTDTGSEQMRAAEEDARRVLSTDYNPRVADADLSAIVLPAAHRVVSGGLVRTAVTAIDPVQWWNNDVPSPAATASTSATHPSPTTADLAPRTIAAQVSPTTQASPVPSGAQTQSSMTSPALITTNPQSPRAPSTATRRGAAGTPPSATSAPGAASGSPRGGYGRSAVSGGAGTGGAVSGGGMRTDRGFGGGGAGGVGTGGAVGTTAARGSGAGMGVMPMGAGAGAGQRGSKEHTPPSYLSHPSHAAELLGVMPKAVDGVIRGKRNRA